MMLAGIASEVPGGLDRAQELLGHWGPDTRDAALRGWEWYYLDSLARQARHTLHAHEGTVRWADWSPDSRLLATAGVDGTVRIWNAETGQVERTIDGHQGGVHCVAWGPRGERIATASADGTARIWTVADGEEVCRFDGHQVDGQPAVFNVVSWNPDGSRVASCGQDFWVRAWDSRTGDEFYESDIGGSAWMISLAWSADGKRLTRIIQSCRI